MAAQVSTTGAPVRRRAWWIAAALAAAALVAAALLIQRARDRSHVRGALPAIPDVSARPSELRDRLTSADHAARETHSLAAVAELGRLYHINGYTDEAAACWTALRDAQPREGKWCYYLADLRRTTGDYAANEELLNETVRRSPRYAMAWLQLAQLQLKSGRLDEAKTSYERRLALLPGDPYARLGLTRVALQRDQRAEARSMLEQLIHDEAKFAPALNLYAELLLAEGDEARAKEQRLKANEASRFREADDPWIEEMYADCYDPQRLAILGTIDSQTNYGDRGRGYLERALRLAPDNRDVAKALSNLYIKLGDLDTARSMLDQTMPRVQPPDAVLYTNRAEVARLQQHSDEALRIVEEALKRLPDAYQLHNERGAVLGDLGRLPESAAAYREAVARAPSDTDSNYSLGITLLALGQRDEAIAYIKRAQILQPTYPKALIMLGRLALESGQLDEAERYIRPLYELHPDQDFARQLMAAWHLRAGMEAARKHEDLQAAEHYRDGFAIDPKNGALGMHLGTLYLTQQRPADAIVPLESFHRSAPKQPESYLYLGQAYAQVGRTEEAKQLLREGDKLATQLGQAETASFCREILQQLP